MMDWEKELEEERREKEEERLQFLKDCHEKSYKLNDGSFTYDCLVYYVCKRYKLDIHDIVIPIVAYGVVNYYFDNNIEVSFKDYLYSDTAPLVRPVNEVFKIFHEFSFLDKASDIVKLANKIYDLDLEIIKGDEIYGGNSYLFSPSFDFNSFTPIDINEIKELKDEIRVLSKYNYHTNELEEKLKEYGLPDNVLELI